MSVCSMTGFGRLLEELPEGRLSIEVRTLNARGREITVHAGGLAVPEAELRELASGRFSRGKIDVSLRLEPTADAGFDTVTGLIEGLRARIAGRDILLQETLLARLILALEGGPGSRRTPAPGPDRVLEAVARACQPSINQPPEQGKK